MSPRKPLSHELRVSYSKKKFPVFAENIRTRRLELGLKQEELAEKLDTKHAVISRYEAGVFPNDPERIIELAKALNVSLDWLFGMPQNDAPKEGK